MIERRQNRPSETTTEDRHDDVLATKQIALNHPDVLKLRQGPSFARRDEYSAATDDRIFPDGLNPVQICRMTTLQRMTKQ